MARLFLSHASRDNAHALAMRDWLAREGWDDVFLDIDPQTGLVAGQRWQEALRRASDRCEAVIFLISEHWLASRWCLAEFLLAKQDGKLIFGALIRPTPFSAVPVEMTTEWQLVDLSAPGPADRFIVAPPPDRAPVEVAFQAEELGRLRAGLAKAGIAADSFAWPPPSDPDRAPYRGLRPLEAPDAGVFFGREAEVLRALDLMRGLRERGGPRLVVILGASGAGKSSFMRAGLLPRLARDDRHFLTLGAVQPGGAARGGDALAEAAFDLARRLDASLDRAAIRAAFAEGPDSAARLLRDLAERRRPLALAGEAPPRPPTIVLPIDQGEALLAGSPGDDGSTLDALGRLLAAEVDLIGVMTIRSDRYGAMQRVEGLAGVNKIPFDLSPMVGGAYSRVITGPAERCAGLSVEPALTEALLRDIDGGGGPEALPLLAFTLERLHRDHAAGGALRLEHYRAMGGLGGAIEAALRTAVERGVETRALPADAAAQAALLRRVMIPRLASVTGRDRSPERRATRYDSFERDLWPVVDLLVDQRLLAKSAMGDEAVLVEPGHESLLRLWSALRDWLAEDAAALKALDGVRAAATEWRETGMSRGYLAHRDERLAEARRLLDRPDFSGALDDDCRAYLKDCEAQQLDDVFALFQPRIERRLEPALRLRENRRASRALGLSAAAALAVAAAADFAPMVTARELAFDAFQRLAPRAYDPTTPVRIVAIDAETLQRFGQWPWPRTYLATLIDRLVDLGAAAIAFDILLPDPDPLSAEVVDVRTRQFPRDGPPAASAVVRTDNDAILADRIARAPVILGALPIAHDRAAEAEDQTLVVRWDAPRAPAEDGACARKFGLATTGGGAAQSALRSFDAAVCPLDMLANAAAGIGLLGAERSVGEVVRRIDLFSTVAGDVTPSLAMEALRVAQGVNTYSARGVSSSGEAGLSAAVATTDSVRVGAVTVPIEPDGSLRVRFSGPEPRRFVSAWRLLENTSTQEPELSGLFGTIVLVGAAAPGMGGGVATPVSGFMTPAEVQAEALETIIGGAWLTRPDWARGVEVMATLGAGLIVSLLAGAFAAGAVLALAGFGAAAAFAASFWTFGSVGLLVDPIPVALAILAPATLAALLAARRAVAGLVGRLRGGGA